MVIAVFGARFLLPILIVAVITGHSLQDVVIMAFRESDEYARHITSAHIQISAFGGMYLLLVFFSFLFESERTLHWLGWVERRLSRLGKLESIEVITALTALLTAQHYLPHEERLDALIAGLAGVILFVLVKSLSALFETPKAAEHTAHKAGFMSFLYLEILDLSFSFDGVIGAFALSKDVVIIMLGLNNRRDVRAQPHRFPGSQARPGRIPVPRTRRPLRHRRAGPPDAGQHGRRSVRSDNRTDRDGVHSAVAAVVCSS